MRDPLSQRFLFSGPPATRPPARLSYPLAVLLVVLFTAIRWPLQTWLHDVPFLLYFPAIFLSAWYGGLGPGLLASLLSAAATQYFFFEPSFSLNVASPLAFVKIGIFIAIGTMISWLTEALHRSRVRVEEASREALLRQEGLRRAEREARESEERFRITADSAPVLIWMAGTDKLCDWFNQPWLEFTGRAMEQELGNGWVEGVHPDDRESCFETYAAAFDARRAFSTEYRLRRHDGEYRWLLETGSPRFAPDGAFTGYIGSCIDIHDRKRYEDDQASIAAEQARLYREAQSALELAEAASRSKDEFLATVSHELRTPLNAMMGWAQLLQLGGTEDLEKTRRGLDVIVRNARLQAQLIDDLLDVSRIVSGKMRLNVRSLQLLPVVEAAIESIRPAAEAKQIRLHRVLDPRSGPVAGDSDRLQQVVWNLLSNAVKFTPKGGKVEVRLERVNSHVEIIVADSGAGIQPDFLPHVFDRFRQQDSSTTRQQGGMGLGLAIVRHLIELHGGTVSVQSPGPGQGSTFIVTLPLSVAHLDDSGELRAHPRVSVSSPLERTLDLGGIRVLVVDDDPDARETLTQILGGTGAEVRAAASAREALEALAELRPDVLVSDLGMPGRDGYDLIREIRELRPEEGGRTPALALTAFARSEDRRRALSAGFQMHLTKPVDIHELTVAVANLARGIGGTLDRRP